MQMPPRLWHFVGVFAVYLASSLSSNVYTVAASSGIDSSLYVPGEILVTFTAPCGPNPAQVSPTEPASFGHLEIDTVIAGLGIQAISKVVPPTENAIGEASGQVDRMYVMRFDTTLSVSGIIDSLASLPCIERMSPNWIIPTELLGTRRYEPQGTRFGEQWYLDTLVVGDYLDIDAPEAWEIQWGDTNVVIGILDTGTMVDTSYAPWRLHNDLDFHRIAEEDWDEPGILNGDDIRCGLNYSDDNGDGIRDNIIGHNFAKAFKCLYPDDLDCPLCVDSDDRYRAAFWRGIPQNWQLKFSGSGSPGDPISWEVDDYLFHGVRVASIAAAKLTGNNIVGTAHGCRIYVLRNYYAAAISDFIAMIDHAAEVCDVINMSWWVHEDELGDFAAAIERAATQWDCVLVAASGNDETTHGVRFPASNPFVLSVGAIAKNGDLTDYSSWKPGEELVDVVASVGDGILAASHTYALIEEAKITGQGTSYAAPQAAGVAALVRARFPGMNQADIRARIKQSANFRWPNTSTNRQMYGGGKLNAYRALSEWGSIATNDTFTTNELPPYVGWQTGMWVSRPGSRDGVYCVSGDLTVEAGATLSIDPGVVVKVSPDHEVSGEDTLRVEITVAGTLNAIGTSSDPIIFESFTDSAPQADDWVGIRFLPGSHGVLKHVIIRNASQDVVIEEAEIAVSAWDTTTTLYLSSDLSIDSDLTIQESDSLFVIGASDVILTGGSSIQISVEGTLICKGSSARKPEFRSSTGQPSSWTAIVVQDESENCVFHNTIVRHAQLGILNHAPLSVDSCSFSDGVIAMETYADADVSGSSFEGLTMAALRIRDGSLVSTDIEVADCGWGILHDPVDTTQVTGVVECRGSTLSNLTYRGISALHAAARITIENSTIEDAGWEGVYVANQDTVVIEGCTIRRNADCGVVALLCDELLITECVIDSNVTAGVYLSGVTSATIETDTLRYSPVGLYCDNSSVVSISAGTRAVQNELGIKCDNESEVVLRGVLVTECGTGVASMNDADVDLGHASGGSGCGASGPDRGLCSIYANDDYHVANFTSTTLPAEGDYWGPTGPKASKFTGSAAIDYDPYICSDPVPLSEIGPPPPDVLPGPGVPKTHHLYAGVPNPFNPTTTIRFDVPPPGGHVSIVVYDVSGARVCALVDGRRTPGTHGAVWDGRDDRGNPVASGVYFVRMSADTFARTNKVVLLK